MKFSLILATIHRKKEIIDFLDSLKNQTYKNFELIICDQNQEPFIEDILKSYVDKMQIIHLKTPRGLSKSRNIGLKCATGDIITFPDDDCIYPKNLLERVKTQFFTLPDIDVLCIRPINENGKTTAGKFLSKKTKVSLFNAPFAFCSFSMFIKKKVFDRIGYFDEKLGLGADTPFQSSEDLDLGIRAIKNGFKVFYNPELVIFHPEKEKILTDETIKRALYYATGTGYVLRKNNYPLWYCLYYMLRPLIGALLSLCKGNRKKIKLHLTKFYGRLIGFKSYNDLAF